MGGRTQFGSPDVDNEVRIAHDGLRGDFVQPKSEASSFDLDAKLIDDLTPAAVPSWNVSPPCKGGLDRECFVVHPVGRL